jgi:hypothetical protein
MAWMVWTLASLALSAFLLAQGAGALAQFIFVPLPLPPAAVRDSQAQSPEAYRADAARLLYGSFPMLVSRDETMDNVFDKAMVAIEIEADGKPSSVRLLRAPTMDEAGPWILALLKRIERFPPPVKLQHVTYTDIWLLDESGQFRLGSLAKEPAVAQEPASPEPQRQ